MIPGREIDEVFVVSEMTIDVVNVPSDQILQFNGTTEWALDSISADEVLWVPWEHQLRELIGPDFVALARIVGADETTWAVTLADGNRYAGADAETAYAAAVVREAELDRSG